MTKQMTPAEIEVIKQSFAKHTPIWDKAVLVGVEPGPCRPPKIPAAIALASVTMI